MMWNSSYFSCCSSMYTAFSGVTSLKARLNAGCSLHLYDNCNACDVFTEHRVVCFETCIYKLLYRLWLRLQIHQWMNWMCTFDKISAFLYRLKVLTLSPIGPQVIARTNYNQKIGQAIALVFRMELFSKQTRICISKILIHNKTINKVAIMVEIKYVLTKWYKYIAPDYSSRQ